MRWKASPTALVPPAQAVTGQVQMPLKPVRMAICAAAMLGMTMGIKKGLTRSKPLARPRLCSSSMVGRLPMPLERMMPQRSRAGSSFSMDSPLSFTASSAAATAIWVKRAIFLASRRSMTVSGSKFLTSPASLTLKLVVSKRVMGPMPQTPARALAQVSAAFRPMGFTVPMPVTTTLRFSIDDTPLVQ